MAVVGVLVGTMVIFGVAGATALVVTRKRMSRQTLGRIAGALVAVESLVIAVGAAAANAARGGSDTLTRGLLRYAGGGWIAVQVVVVAWWVVAWQRSRR